MMDIPNTLFVFLYKFYNRYNDFSPRFSSILVLLLVCFFYLFSIVVILEILFELDLTPKFEGVYHKEKGMLTLSILMLPLFFLLNRYYNHNRVRVLIEKHSKQNVFSWGNIAKVTLFVLFPLVFLVITYQFK